MKYIACCLLCNDTVDSPIVKNGSTKLKQLSKVLTTFCEYLKFDPDLNIDDDYQGRFFPFCTPCSFQIYKLYDYHKQKMRILELVADLVTSLRSLMLRNRSKEFKGEDDEPGVTNLSGQVITMRKCLVRSNNNSSSLVLHEEPSAETSNNEPKARYSPRPTKAISNSTAYRTATANNKANSSVIVQVDVPQNSSSGDEDPAHDPLHVELENEGNVPDFEPENSDEDMDDNIDALSDEGEEETELKFNLDDGTTIPCENMDPRVSKYQTAIPGKFSYRGFGFKFKKGNMLKCESCMYSITRRGQSKANDYRILKHIDKRHVENFGMVKVRPNEYLFASKYKGFKMPDGSFSCGVPGCSYTCNNVHFLCKHLRCKHHAPRKTPKRGKLDYDNVRLMDIEIAPNRYAYKDYTFKLERKEFYCESCMFLCQSKGLLKILRHLEVHHVQKAGLTEVRPDELLIHGQFPAYRLPDGKFQCGFDDCKVVIGLTPNLIRHFHQVHNSNQKCGPNCQYSGKASKSRAVGSGRGSERN